MYIRWDGYYGSPLKRAWKRERTGLGTFFKRLGNRGICLKATFRVSCSVCRAWINCAVVVLLDCAVTQSSGFVVVKLCLRRWLSACVLSSPVSSAVPPPVLCAQFCSFACVLQFVFNPFACAVCTVFLKWPVLHWNIYTTRLRTGVSSGQNLICSENKGKGEVTWIGAVPFPTSLKKKKN